MTEWIKFVRVSRESAREQILDAALGCFTRYGYRRTSMELLANAAGMSRPALYQHFSGKEELFKAMGARLLDGVIATAGRARDSGDSVADRLYQVLAAKLALFSGSVDGRYRSELILEAGVVAADLLASFHERFIEIIVGLLTGARDELDLVDQVLPAREAAILLADALSGIEQESAGVDTLHRRLRQLVDLTVRGLSTRPAAGAPAG